jgi:hypothetical protein
MMFKLFSVMNARLWWRSLQGLEIAAILFYGLFVLLIAGQFTGVVVLLLFTDDIETAQMFYPWITEDIQYFVHLLFVNILWANQVFFTKINRLKISENRKLLTFGMPARKLSVYLNIAGFLHPINALFHFFWILYAGFLSETYIQFAAGVLLVVTNYALIYSLKWRFRIFTAEKFRQVGAVVSTFVLFFILVALYLDVTPFISSMAEAADLLTGWLIYTPGYLFYYVFGVMDGTAEEVVTISILGIVIVTSVVDIIRNTKMALLTPVQNTSHKVQTGQLALFIKWLGHEGGKYFYAVWNHKYSKIQLMITYVFVVPYIIFLGDTSYIIGVFLTLLPIIFLLVMLTNMFGFENRELLLSLQFPIRTKEIVRQRIQTAILVCLGGSSLVFILVPVFITGFAEMTQVYLGILCVVLVFLHYILKSSIINYKKVEEVSVMSVSNPVLPASITFIAVFIVMILGIGTFIFFESIIYYHIALLAVVNLLLFISFKRKLSQIEEPFIQKVIPKLWNEL